MPQGAPEINHNSEEFEALFKRHEADLYRYARYLADTTVAAEDIYQETWLRVAKHIHNGKAIQNFKKFLFTVATNIHRDELRKIKTRRFFLGPSMDDDEQNQNIWVSPDVSSEEFFSDALEESLSHLSARQRSMFCLNYIEGFKIAEIAKMMNCADGTVKATIYKAVQKLRRDLKEFREKDEVFTD
jgi:RNA polymerase sigma-70 factor (ECF subfamily)